jgi:hypothetical protein
MAGTQRTWRFCGQCNALFFDGVDAKGVCAGGGGHQAMGWEFTLPYDFEQVPPLHQPQWRFCGDCYALFYDGYADKGRCPAGGAGHRAYGFDYAPPHEPAA